jgi:hypothetical protein
MSLATPLLLGRIGSHFLTPSQSLGGVVGGSALASCLDDSLSQGRKLAVP